MVESLWPEDITQTTIVAPTTILKEQGTLLSERTKNTVVAEVQSEGSSDGITVRFILFAPSLNYRVELFRLYVPIALYPLEGVFEDTRQDIHSAEGLKKWLKGIFSSDHAKKVVQGLFAQAIA